MTQAPQLARQSVGTAKRRRPYWLIAKRRCGRLEVLITSLADGRRVMPVFSFEEEAALFLCLGVEGSWQVRPTGPGELASLLYGPCREVELAALDPVSDVETDVMNGLVSIGRKKFVNVLLSGQAPRQVGPGDRPYRLD